jgi:CopG family nickel-responsive transcriptional regulator
LKDALVRFGVAMEGSLLGELDALVAARGGTRSEALRDLVRAEVSEARAREHVHAVGTLTLVYDHHVRDLSDRLTELQHELGESVRSTMHVHLSHDLCLEVIVMKGWADELQGAADRILSVRGVTHGGIEIVALEPDALPRPTKGAKQRAPRVADVRPHEHPHDHAHPHEHSHAHSHAAPGQTHAFPARTKAPVKKRSR